MWKNESLLDTTIVSGQFSFVLMLFCTSDIERESLNHAYARTAVADYTREADRWPRTLLSGEILKVGF